jgi:hypothetical protein
MNPVAAQYAHEVTKTLDGFSVVYKSTPLPLSASIMMFYGLLLFIPIGVLSLWLKTGWLIFFMLLCGASFGIHRMATTWRATGGTFSINDQFIDIQGEKYSRDNIRKIYIANRSGGERKSMSSETGFVAVGQGFTGATVAAGMQLNHAAQKIGEAVGEAAGEEFAKVSHKIEFIYGSKAKIVLAKNLDGESADALFQDIQSILTANTAMASTQPSMQ